MNATTRTSPAPAGATRPATSAPGPVLRVLPGGSTGQLCLPYEYDVAPGVPAVPPVPADLHLVVTANPDPADATPLPDPGPWAARLARACAEVAVGARPPGQLTRHVQRDVLAQLARRGVAVARHPSSRTQRGITRLRTVRAVRVCPVAPGIVETSAVIIGGERAQAIAIRLEAVEGRWLATVVQLG